MLVMDIDEKQMKLSVTGGKAIDWFLDMTAAEKAVLPFKTINANKIDCQFEGMRYAVTTIKGTFSKPDDKTVFRIKPNKNVIQIDLSGKK
jgi:tRNA A37 threonylcarbamoyltransferase TsaD